jgi:soluble lytic murein transglycosylase-like protein
MLANGRGIPRDDTQAAFFFSLAAAQQHVQAQRMLRFVGAPATEQPPCMAPPQTPPPVEAPDEDFALPAGSPAQRRVWALVNRLAPEYGIHPRLAMAVIRAESNFDPAAVSPKNAQGLMQLIPETSARFNVTKPFDPEQNIRGGLAYLRWLLAYFKGQVPLVAAAYNAGEGAVNKYRGIPPYAETRGYVRRIVELFKRHDHPFDARVTEPSPELPRIHLAPLM